MYRSKSDAYARTVYSLRVFSITYFRLRSRCLDYIQPFASHLKKNEQQGHTAEDRRKHNGGSQSDVVGVELHD